MIIQKEFLTKLKGDFKLNIYEVKIWASLLSKGIAAAGELADLSGVPRSRCYDVLESLEKKGYIIMKIGRPIKYIAVKPEEIVERVKKDIKHDQEINLNMLEGIRSTSVFKELELLHKTGIEKIDSESLSNILNGKSAIYSFIKKSIDRASSSIVVATTKENFNSKMKLFKNFLPSLEKKKVKLDIYAPIDEPVNDLKVVRTDLNSRFIVFDGNETLFMLADSTDKTKDTAILVKSEFFSNALVGLVEGHVSGK
ncbi:MAG: helix-turn-helix domain-containing protein [Candidatus Woesearchaeota archaeon]|jgi:sugar-specific transcriptional regulator TrmB|nr:helix-turn-helix domain-containing protein [Candidatus Woesearchaeota archaeon]